MKISRRVVNRIALAIAVGCVLINSAQMFVQFRTYGIDSFLLAAVILVVTMNFKNDERYRAFWILGIVAAVMGVAAGVMNIMGMQ